MGVQAGVQMGAVAIDVAGLVAEAAAVVACRVAVGGIGP